MSSLNRVELLGNVGRDPDVRYNTNGDPIVNLSIATSEKWTDKNTGERREKTEWHKVVFFQGLAKIAEQYISKGSKIFIAGKLQTRKWQDKDGNDRWSTEIVVSGYGGQLILLSPAKEGGQSNSRPTPAAAEPAAAVGGIFDSPEKPQAADDFEDDIPF